MNLTYYGHSCFLLEAGGSHVLFDPFIRPNPLAEDVKVDQIKADYILLSHGHGDHVADVEEIGQRTGAKLVGMYEVLAWFERKGLDGDLKLNIGGTVKLPFGTVQLVAATHSSSLPDGAYGGLAAGFVVEAEGKTLYFAGDSALTYDMKLVGERNKVDYALLPIGDHFTMGIDDALVAANWTGAAKIIGMHYDTFPPIAIDHAAVQAKAREANQELILMKIGETITL